ncbi:hypothetical protein J2847_001870 [Azospirillum agricola]|uniref:hypothetical protein n=1 Tax=Azospirillum agricola TaxID=1720247 RepID=UPI001AE11203|nr:hypothetical protein [Azospirillum agricola]MBP2228579.1 hypothetical protein [Azospirillum agricola]
MGRYLLCVNWRAAHNTLRARVQRRLSSEGHKIVIRLSEGPALRHFRPLAGQMAWQAIETACVFLTRMNTDAGCAGSRMDTDQVVEDIRVHPWIPMFIRV